MSDITGILIFGVILSAIFLILDVVTLISTGIRIKKATKSVLFVNMITFTLAQFAVFCFYLIGAIDGKADEQYTKNQDPPRVLMYLFYLTSITLLLFVWVNRIKTTFQDTKWKYSAKLMKTIYILVSIVPFFQTCAMIVTVVQKDPTPADNPIYKLMSVFAVLYLLLTIGLTIFLGYLFIKRCIVLIQFKLDIEVSGTHDDNSDLVYKLVEIQTKLTVLIIVAVISTFVNVILNLISNIAMEPHIGAQLAPIWTNIDTFINFYCIALILKQNLDIYSKVCTPCVFCFYKCNNRIKPSKPNPVPSRTNTGNAKTLSAVNNQSVHTIQPSTTQGESQGSSGNRDSKGSGADDQTQTVAATPTPQHDDQTQTI